MRISQDEYQKWKYDYYHRGSNYERLGQAFINKFWKVITKSSTNTDLYYETDDKKAEKIIYDYYVEV